MTTTRIELPTPDHRLNGKYQFVRGWTAGGAEMCVHLTAEQITDRCTRRYGGGRLIDDGKRLWWEQDFAQGDVDDSGPIVGNDCPVCQGRGTVMEPRPGCVVAVDCPRCQD